MRRQIALALVAYLILVGEAKAVELFRAVPLPDDGQGSSAQSEIVDFIDSDEFRVVGSKINFSGMNVPMIWDYDHSSGVVTPTQLPLPYGSEGEAVGGAVFPNGDMVAIGNIWSGGATWGVLWRRPSMGSWGMPQLLCADATESYASRADYSGESGGINEHLLEVVGSALEGGRWQPVLHRVTTDAVVTVDLPLPQGWNGAALGVDAADAPGDQTTAVGWVEGPNGRRRPVAWVDTGQQWMLTPIRLPNGAEGQANNLTKVGAGTQVVGEITRNGRTRGFWDRENPVDDTAAMLLRPLAGYSNSTATLVIGGPGLGGGPHVFGTSSNPGGDPVATGWINRQPFPVQQLLLDPSSVAEVRSFKPTSDDLATAGQIVSTPGGQPQASLFLPTGTHVPDNINVVVGNIVDFNNDGFPDFLWRNDDNSLFLRTRRAGGMRTAVVDLTFTQFANTTFDDEAAYTIVARAESNRPNTSGTLNVYAYNWSNQQWQLLNSFTCTDTDQEVSAEFPDPIPHWLINPNTGAIQLRLEFIGNGNGPIALVADMARINMQ